MNKEKLGKEISYALRHAPEEYDLILNKDGWTNLNDLIASINRKHLSGRIKRQDIIDMIECSTKKRYEIDRDQIRALYGHSIDIKINYTPSKPPDMLFHGTASRFLDNIFKIGLISEKRQYVHLTENIIDAKIVGKRYDKNPIILKISAYKAFESGIVFYYADNKVWLSDSIPSKYISIIQSE